MRLGLYRRVGGSYINFRFDPSREVQVLCDQEIPPRGMFSAKIRDCPGRQLILDIQRLQSESRVTYLFLMGPEGDLSKDASMKLNSQREVIRFEFSNLQDTIEFALVNPSFRKTIHLKLTIFEGPSGFAADIGITNGKIGDLRLMKMQLTSSKDIINVRTVMY